MNAFLIRVVVSALASGLFVREGNARLLSLQLRLRRTMQVLTFIRNSFQRWLKVPRLRHPARLGPWSRTHVLAAYLKTVCRLVSFP